MTEPILDCAGIVACIGQGVAAANAAACGRHRKVEAGALARCPLHRQGRPQCFAKTAVAQSLLGLLGFYLQNPGDQIALCLGATKPQPLNAPALALVRSFAMAAQRCRRVYISPADVAGVGRAYARGRGRGLP